MGERGHPNCDLIRRLYAARARDDRDEIRTILVREVIASDTHALFAGGNDG